MRIKNTCAQATIVLGHLNALRTRLEEDLVLRDDLGPTQHNKLIHRISIAEAELVNAIDELEALI